MKDDLDKLPDKELASVSHLEVDATEDFDDFPDEELEDEITETRLIECVREQAKKDMPHASSFFVGGIFQLRHVFAHGIIHFEHVWLIEMNVDKAPMALYRVRGLTEECLEAIRVF